MNRVFNLLGGGNRLTVLHEFLPVTLIGRVFGVFPLKIINDTSGNQVFVTSRSTAIYSIVLLVLSLVHLIYLPAMTIAVGNFVNGVNSTKNYSVEKFLHNPLTSPPLLIRFLNGIVMSMMGISSKINALLSVRRNLPRTLASLNSTDDLLGVRPKNRKKNIRTIWMLAGFGVLVGLPGQISSSMLVARGRSYFIGTYALVNILNNLTAVSAEAQFLAMCYILKSRFDMINRKLADLLDPCQLEKPTQHLDLKNVAASRREFSIRNNHLSVIGDQENSARSKRIKNLKSAHVLLCDFLDRVNHMFQVQILFSICGCFLNQLFNMYSFFVGGAWKLERFRDANASRNMDHGLLTHPLTNLSWWTYYGARFIAMATMASKTTNSAKKAIVHILGLRQSCKDFATNEMLILFYDHLASRKIEFSAAGFFKLDIALISSVVTTGSTYIVMMVQFKE